MGVEINNMEAILNAYTNELDQVLDSCDINEYDKFIKKWHDLKLISKKTYETYLSSDDRTRMNSYCHLILGSKHTLEESKEWARNHIVNGTC